MTVEVADQQAEMVRGLTGRKRIGSDGMLFVFPEEHVGRFNTAGMLFAIDMLFMDTYGNQVGVYHNVAPGVVAIGPVVPYRFVLEVPAGFLGRRPQTIKMQWIS